MSSPFHHETVTLTSEELTVISDILRRQTAQNIFTGKPEFATAGAKIEHAKWRSYVDNPDNTDLGTTPDQELEWWRKQFPAGTVRIS